MSLRTMNHHNPITSNVSVSDRQNYGTLNVHCHIYRLLQVRIPMDDQYWESPVPEATREETVSMEIPTSDLLRGSFDNLPCLVCNSYLLSERRILQAFHSEITRDYYTVAALLARRELPLLNDGEWNNSRISIPVRLVNMDTRVVTYEEYEEIIRRSVEESMAYDETFTPATGSPIEAGETVELCGAEDEKCCICLEEFEGGVKVGRLPCSHVFHGDCIDQWLKRSPTCPLCRFVLPCHQD
ncbi:ERAD-associated E3 ubiquitin-protein ligase HRD1A-like [Mangifera indica]|uniref:ERAD-associated E3 ubiquitin-protein ligase HRD1A-like n=1 Tax=Mangifera indica TaxID=29780 RepID=UPI001CFBB054|nr:ERAD-associated E3 ubiquitin-protein ligase HRD1A-like [Mangifera indica]